jgi:(1->4)-alpha-D-glucan 1-alpha-D-glucosylmutase
MSADWVGTYRLQVHAGFDLEAARSTLPYLAALGVSHVYLSPCLQAVAGSTHGYDVTNPTVVSADLGGEDAWAAFTAAARAAKLHILLDIVPNHMAAAPSNFWWDDVLANGPFSAYHRYFDLRMDPCEPWRVYMACLGRPYGEALAAGEIQIEIVDALPRIRHHDDTWPITPASWDALLDDQSAPPLRDLAQLRRAVPDPEALDAYHAASSQARVLLAEPRRAAELAAAAAGINASPERLHELLCRQFYALHGWKLAGELTNYRRFFDIGTLVGIRQEVPEVFEVMHQRIATMLRAGELDGVRVDHPDGLRDPFQYFGRLRSLLPTGRIYVEKILENDERLQEDWPVDGTVGYDFLAKVNRLWMDDQRSDQLTALYADFTGHPVNIAALVREKKRAVLESAFAADLERLTSAAAALAAGHWQTVDTSRRALREALARVTVALPVYRTYRRERHASPECKRLLTDALQAALMSSPDLDAGVFEFLSSLLTADQLTPEADSFIASWQQLSPAVMAKGVEDTIFYSYDRLVSCNEVGGQASLLGIPADKFHEFCHALHDRWPGNLLTTSTHDNKRSEDVRTRISVLSEIPDRWSEALHQWSQQNAAAWQNRPPDRHAEYLLYQTLIGAWPIDRERCWQYMQKACREAKIMTSWHEPNLAYEETIRGFIDGIYASAAFVANLERFIEPLILPGRINSLAQTLIKMTAPGVPDFYQGTELWDLSLVDPDNRRPVDFERRAALVERLKSLIVADVCGDWNSGLPKLWLIARVLELRRRRPQHFAADSGYQPLVAHGAHIGKLFAFQRGAGLIVVVPRFTLTRGGDWGDTMLGLPEGTWRNHLADTSDTPVQGTVSPATLFAAFPVALLLRDET